MSCILSDEAIEALARIDPDDGESIDAFIRLAEKPRFMEYVRDGFVANILYGPATHGRNILGNAAFLATELPVTALRAGFSRISGSGSTSIREVPAMAAGILHGIPSGFRGFLDGLQGKSMGGKFDTPMRNAFERSPSKFVRDRVAPVMSAPGRALSAADNFFKSMAFSAKLHAEAVRSGAGMAGDELKRHVDSYLANPPEEGLKKAGHYAKFTTFQDDVSAVTEGLIQARGAVGGGAHFFFPFLKIADRLIVRGMEFVPPVGGTRAMMAYSRARRAGQQTLKVTDGVMDAVRAGGSEAIARLKEQAARNAPDAAKVRAEQLAAGDDLMARAVLGLGAGLVAASYAADDSLTGPVPTNAAERERFYAEGRQPYSIRLGDSWVPIQHILGPIATPIVMIATATQKVKEGEAGDAEVDELVSGALRGLLQQQLDASYLATLGDLSDAQRSDKAFADLWQRPITGLQPLSALTRSAAVAMDPRVVETKTMGDRFKAQIPGLRNQLRSRLTRFGEPVEPATGRARAFSPIVPTKAVVDPVEELLERAGEDVGFVKPTKVGNVELSPNQQRRYQEIYGQEVRRQLEALAARAGKAEPARLAAVVRKIKNSAGDIARAKLLREIRGK